jgi:hypothetical protein
MGNLRSNVTSPAALGSVDAAARFGCPTLPYMGRQSGSGATRAAVLRSRARVRASTASPNGSGLTASTVGIQSEPACGTARSDGRFSERRFSTFRNGRAAHSTVDTQNSVCIIRSHRRARNLRFSGVFTSFSQRHSQKLAPLDPSASNLSPGTAGVF